MSNGTKRIALSQIQLGNKKAQSEQEKLLSLSKKGSKLPKISLKYPAKHNRSK